MVKVQHPLIGQQSHLSDVAAIRRCWKKEGLTARPECPRRYRPAESWRRRRRPDSQASNLKCRASRSTTTVAIEFVLCQPLATLISLQPKPNTHHIIHASG